MRYVKKNDKDHAGRSDIETKIILKILDIHHINTKKEGKLSMGEQTGFSLCEHYP